MKKQNNSGVVFVNVLIICAIVLILSSTAAAVAWRNYRNKLKAEASQANLYACEEVLDEIRVALRNSLNDCGSDTTNDKAALSGVFGEYAIADGTGFYHSGTTEHPNEEGVLNMEYLTGKVLTLDGENVTKRTAQYSGGTYPDGYILETDGAKATITVDQSDNSIFLKSDCVLLKNLTVRYEHDGYADTIDTDIRVNYTGDGDITDVKGDLCDFSVVSFGGLKVSGSRAGALIIYGDMYLQAKASLQDDYSYALFVDGDASGGTTTFVGAGDIIILNGDLVVKNGAVVRFPDSSRVYVNGSIRVDNSSTLDVGDAAIFITATDAAGNAHTVEYNSFNCDIDEEKLLSISSDEFPARDISDFLDSGTLRHIGNAYYNIGVSNPELFGTCEGGSTLLTEENGVCFDFTVSGAADYAGSADPGIILFRTDAVENGSSSFNQTYTGVLISLSGLTIAPQQKVYDNNYKLNASVLKPLGEENYRALIGDEGEGMDGLSINISLYESNSITGEYTAVKSDVSLPVKYLLADEGDVTVEVTGSSRGTAAMTSHTAISVSYENWKKR